MPALVRRLGHLPIVGYFVRLAIALARLPNRVRDQREFSGYVLSQNQQIADFNQRSFRTRRGARQRNTQNRTTD